MRLILLTQRYPWGPGEEFVHLEVQSLAAAGVEIEVVPTHALTHESPHERALPENVRVRADMVAFFRAQRGRPAAARVAEMLSHPDCAAALAREVGTASFLRPFRLLPSRLPQAIGYLTHAHMVRQALLRFSTRGMVYSYWLQAAALGAALADFGPITARAHGADLYRERQPNDYLPLQEATMRQLAMLLPISQHGLLYAAKRFPKIRLRLHLSRLGVAAAPRLSCMGTAGQPLRVLSCSSAIPLKRLDILCEALRLYGDEVHWTHLGDGPTLHIVRERAKKLPPRVSWRFTGHQTAAEVQAHYQTHQVDVFINCSETEGLPVSVMEALSYGVHVIAFDVGGLSEVVDAPWLLGSTPAAGPLAQRLRDFAALPNAARRSLQAQSQAKWRHVVNASVQYAQLHKLLLRLNRTVSPVLKSSGDAFANWHKWL